MIVLCGLAGAALSVVTTWNMASDPLRSYVVGWVLGVVAGSAAYALATRKFRWEGFASMADLRNQLVGAGLMGFGGVTAMGCTVGQGLSGVSTLAIGSFIALGGIIAGSVATLKYVIWREEREG